MTQPSARIVRKVHDEPNIEGSQITIHFIKERDEGRGLNPDTVADPHHLDIAEVYRALADYHDHPEEMRMVEAERERIHTEAEDDPAVSTGPTDT